MAYKKILVPLNGSELAEKALPYAKSIAIQKNGHLVLFAVSLTIFNERRDRLFESYLEVSAKDINAEGIKTSAATGYGDIAEEIVKYSGNNKIDLIVMATHGYTRAKRWMFGSITQKVLYGSEIPVLLIKSKTPAESVQFNRILVPVDGSPFSESTFTHVKELAGDTDREVLLLHVCEPPVVPSYGSRPINPTWKKYRDDMWDEMEKQATTYLKKTEDELEQNGLKVRTRVVKALTGEVARVIMQIAKEEDIDLVAIATQGRSGVRRLVYGSVANKIVEEASQSMLLIRPATSVSVSPPQSLLDDIWHNYLANKT